MLDLQTGTGVSCTVMMTSAHERGKPSCYQNQAIMFLNSSNRPSPLFWGVSGTTTLPRVSEPVICTSHPPANLEPYLTLTYPASKAYFRAGQLARLGRLIRSAMERLTASS